MLLLLLGCAQGEHGRAGLTRVASLDRNRRAVSALHTVILSTISTYYYGSATITNNHPGHRMFVALTLSLLYKVLSSCTHKVFTILAVAKALLSSFECRSS